MDVVVVLDYVAVPWAWPAGSRYGTRWEETHLLPGTEQEEQEGFH
jgi:hypothetical protein